MLVIVGLIVLLVAGILAIAGVLSNAGAAHPLTENSPCSAITSGVDRQLFLFGIVVGAVALLELRVLLAGARRTAGPRPDAQRPASNAKWRSSTEPATPGSNTNSEPTARRSHRGPDESAKRRRRNPLLGRWSRDRQSMNSGRVEGARSPGL